MNKYSDDYLISYLKHKYVYVSFDNLHHIGDKRYLNNLMTFVMYDENNNAIDNTEVIPYKQLEEYRKIYRNSKITNILNE